MPSKERSTFTDLDRDGTWSFEGLPPGEYLIGVGVQFKTRWDPIRMPFWYPAATRPEYAEIIRVGEGGAVRLALRNPAAPREVQFSGASRTVGRDRNSYSFGAVAAAEQLSTDREGPSQRFSTAGMRWLDLIAWCAAIATH
jgi:hypothetical protein